MSYYAALLQEGKFAIDQFWNLHEDKYFEFHS